MTKTFHETMFQIIRDYKALRKRIYERNAATSAVYKKLGINRMTLRTASDVKLYNIGQNILRDLEDYIEKKERISTIHCGVEEFLVHVKNSLNEYKVENQNIINNRQKVSCDMLDAIQMIALPTEKITSEIIDKINLFACSIQQHGSAEQIEIFSKAIKQNIQRFETFFKKCGKMLSIPNEISEAKDLHASK